LEEPLGPHYVDCRTIFADRDSLPIPESSWEVFSDAQRDTVIVADEKFTPGEKQLVCDRVNRDVT
jgi:hypothetical protein